MEFLHKVHQLLPPFISLIGRTWVQMGSMVYKIHRDAKDISRKSAKSARYRGTIPVGTELVELERIRGCELDHEWSIISRGGVADLLGRKLGNLPSNPEADWSGGVTLRRELGHIWEIAAISGLWGG